ncbi:MAG TPA: UvrB/UvrC motif-containing protein [Candidatus Moranbacteria bacterium]|nr:UvrB/UvrC motif-containing protein [Candidatus Moranbacteria bacterium]
MSSLKSKIAKFPNSPGVYIFKNKTGDVLYVGKATSLKDRVSSYFVGVQFIEPKTEKGLINQTPTYFSGRPIEIMIHEVSNVEIRKTDTVLEAYILEQNLIKKLQPKYNIDGKDDKSFVYVVITKDEFPRILIARGRELDKIFNFSAKGGSASGGQFPIFNKLPISNYQFLKNSESLKAISYKLKAIYGPYTSKKQIEIALKILRKIFPYHNKKENSEKGCLDYQIGLCPGPYDGAISAFDYQKNIRGIRMILEGKKKNLINTLKKEMNEFSKKEEFEKALDIRNKIFALQHIRDVALISDSRGQKFLFPTKQMRIEGYDISNISGSHNVGSMVVFDNSLGEMGPNKNEYRKFKIKTISGANDVGAMREILIRRFQNSWTLPNLILLDGGAGHLNMARKILRNYKLEIPIMAVAKGPSRKKLDIRKFGSVPEISLNLIQQIRDKAHRFAIGYHRKLRNKEFRRAVDKK